MDVGYKDLDWEETSNHTRKSRTLAVPTPPLPGHTEGAQFIKMKTTAVQRREPKLGTGASALWFAKAWTWRSQT